MKNILPKLIISTLVGFIPLLIPLPAFAASSLFLSPSPINVWPSDTFTVQLKESSGGTNINAVAAKLNYDNSLLTLTCPTGVSIANTFVIPGSDTVGFGNLTSCATPGTVTIVQGSATNGPPPGPLYISVDNKLLATITFKATATDAAGSRSANVLFDTTTTTTTLGTYYKYLGVVNNGIDPTNATNSFTLTNGTITLCKIADLNCSGDAVDYHDAALFLTAYGTSNAAADMYPLDNPDGTVDYHDASIFLSHYGT